MDDNGCSKMLILLEILVIIAPGTDADAAPGWLSVFAA
jgi:hypothetical protein